MSAATPPVATVVPRMPTRPKRLPPPGACDAHAHVFGPYDRFPLALPSAYPPPDAPYAAHARVLATLGLAHGVIVQPAPYGTDNRALLDALAQSGGRWRGVALAAVDIENADLATLDEGGVRGLRFVDMLVASTGRPYPGSQSSALLGDWLSRLRYLEWHAEFWGTVEQCVALANQYAGRGVPLVFDHLAGANLETRVDDPVFKRLLAHLATGSIWIKLSLCRAAQKISDYPRMREVHQALLETNPRRLLWGSDFPFVQKGAEAPDAGALLDQFLEWSADPVVIERVLVENPRRLYGY